MKLIDEMWEKYKDKILYFGSGFYLGLAGSEENLKCCIEEIITEYEQRREKQKECKWKEYSKKPFLHFKPSCSEFENTSYIAYSKPRDGKYCSFCGGKIVEDK